MTDSELASIGVDRATFDALVARAERRLRGQSETIQSIETRDGGQSELTPRFETKTPYWVGPIQSAADRIAEREIENGLSLDATPPQMLFKHEWRDIERKDALLFTSTKDLTPDQHRRA